MMIKYSINSKRGTCKSRIPLDSYKWHVIINIYYILLKRNHKYSSRLLANECKISLASAQKAMCHANFSIIPLLNIKDRGNKGIGVVYNL